jgi:D-3-phosphoglycerate dehydrogenase
MRVLLADKLASDVVASLKKLGVTVEDRPELSGAELAEAVKDFEVLVVRSTEVTKPIIQAAKRLGLIIRAGAGVNTIDVATASSYGVYVANCPGVNSAAVAELTIGLLIAADRRIVDACVDLRAGRWRKKEFGKARGLKGRTLGLLGFGAIAKAVAETARAMQMQVLAWSRSLTPDIAAEYDVTFAPSPLEIAERSDAVSIHLALAPETRHIVNADFLARMRPGAILINTARGPMVDTAALSEAIASRRLHVAMDVYENEPEGGEAAFAADELIQAVTGTPHIGASTDQTSEAIGREVVRIIREYLQHGRVPGAVNLMEKTPATHHLTVRHYNRVGVLATVLNGLREEKINVEEMQNLIFDNAAAAVCTLALDQGPSQKFLDRLTQDENILQVTLVE